MYIMSLVCKVCCDSLPHIRNEAGFRGIKKGMVNVDKYANGVASIHFIHLCLTQWKNIKRTCSSISDTFLRFVKTVSSSSYKLYLDTIK